jgi:hypothetical protein
MTIWTSWKLQKYYDDVCQNLATNSNQAELPHGDKDQTRPTTPVKTGEANTNVDVELGEMELCQLELVQTIPYKVSTGLLVLGLFVISFAIIITMPGIVHDLPSLFNFFSNIYLAGTIVFGCALSVLADLT